jgi:AcrR family transcriptional regulator
MSRAPDPAVRQALIDRAAAILAEEGQAKLTLRRLTRDVGVSTMAVYTHFGSMEQLRIEICDEGFRRLADHLASAGQTKDSAAELRELGRAYVTNARENPNLYRAMFLEPLPDPLPERAKDWGATFQVLVAAVQRGLEHPDATATVDADGDGDTAAAGDADAASLATLLWAIVHGLVSLELTGQLQPAQTDAALAQLETRVLVAGAPPIGPRR